MSREFRMVLPSKETLQQIAEPLSMLRGRVSAIAVMAEPDVARKVRAMGYMGKIHDTDFETGLAIAIDAAGNFAGAFRP